jgi:hypothetical protein
MDTNVGNGTIVKFGGWDVAAIKGQNVQDYLTVIRTLAPTSWEMSMDIMQLGSKTNLMASQ